MLFKLFEYLWKIPFHIQKVLLPFSGEQFGVSLWVRDSHQKKFVVRCECLTLLAALFLITPAIAFSSPSIIINEVDSDTPSIDTEEFIELYDGGVGNTALDGLVLVFFNGNDDESYKSIDLDGNSTNSNGYFVVGDSGVNGVGGTTFGTTPLQNGEDAVALYQDDATDFPNGTPVTTINLIDALVYDTGGEDDNGLLVLHNANEPQINENGNGKKQEHSNQRCSNGSGGQRNTSNYLQATPTPNAANNCTTIVAFSQIAYQINEDGTIVAPQMTINRSGNTMSASSVQVILNNGSDPAATGGTSGISPDDFDNTTLIVNFAADETSKTVIVSLNDDTKEEDNEKVSLTLANPTNATLGTPTTTTLTINDDDSPSELLINEIDYAQVGSDNAEFIELKNVGSNAIDFSATPYELKLVDASGPTVDKTISLDSGIVNANDYFVICGDVTQVVNCDLDVSPNTGLLENGIEAVALMKSNLIVDVVSYAGDVSGYVEATGTVEDSNDIALISLSRYPDGVDTNNNSSDFSQRCITPGFANIANSSDCLLPFVQFTQASYVVDENIGNSNVVNLSRSGNNINSLSTEVSISIMGSGTATAGTDFTDSSFPLSVIFALNETNKTITVPINDDSLDETDETINFSVAATSNAIIGTQGIATLNITDNDVRLIVNAPNGGTVTSDNLLDCGSICTEDFSAGSPVTLFAMPATDYVFGSWGGDCNGTGNSFKLTMDVDKTCSAIFLRANDNAQTPPSSQTPPISRYTLTIEKTGNGTVTSTPTGILCGANSDQCRYEFEGGETIKLSTTPNARWVLAAWNGDCDDNGYIELLKDATCQIKFALESVTLNDLEVTGVENGLLDFGTLLEGSAPIIKTLTLTNTALITMDVTGFTLPIGFSLIGDFPENLVPSESVDIQIQWNALTVGHYKDELSFNINGLLVSYTLSGTVIAGEKEAVNEVESVIASEKESSEKESVLDHIETTIPIPSQPDLTTAPTTASAFNSPTATFSASRNDCSTTSILLSGCNAGGKTVTNLKEIKEGGQLVNATIETEVINHGWVSNVIIAPDGVLSSGIATGSIKVEGRIESREKHPFDFRGISLSGLNEEEEVVGTLGGTIFNKSKVGGSIQNILLAPNTHVIGGVLKGQIIGDSDEPAILEELTIKRGAMLENVIIGRNVKYAQGIDFGSGVQFVTQGLGIDRFGDFMPTRTNFLGNIRTQKQRHANGIKLSRNIASTVQIKNKLFIEAEHVGESAEFLIVCYYKSATRSIAYMRDENNWKVWDGEVGSLQAAVQYDSLPEKMEIIVFEGDLSEMPGTFTLFSGYRLDRSQSIIYNGDEPIQFSVSGINQSGFFGE